MKAIDNIPDQHNATAIADRLFEMVSKNAWGAYVVVTKELWRQRHPHARRGPFHGDIPHPTELKGSAGRLAIEGQLYPLCEQAARKLVINTKET